jgi:hypothetical protein
MGMTGRTTSPYVLERIKAFQEKARIVKKMLGNKALAAQDYAAVKEEVNDKLRAMELGDVSDTWLRMARHEARREHGLPSDALDSPENNEALRYKTALDIARERHGDVTQSDLQAAVRERLGGGRSIGSSTATKAIRQVQKEIVRSTRTTPANGAPAQEARAVLDDLAKRAAGLLSADAEAALGLAAEALHREGIITLTLSINPDGKASYIAEKRTISEVKGSI